ncbi:MAG: ribonuclease R, partial [Bacteroides sp.]|nr:ribonuclease R [Bacteroides sp.]
MTKSSTNKSAAGRKAAALVEKIKEYVAQQKNNTYNYKQVSHAIGATTPVQQRNVAMQLVEMSFNGDIIEVSPGKYRSPQRYNEATGTFQRRSNGKNSVITDGDGETLLVAERNSLHALNGDKVRVNIAARRRGQEPEAEVIEIIEKNDQTFIGTLKVDKHFAYLLTDSKFLATDIFIPRSKLKGGKTGDKAVVRITEWKEDFKNPSGEVIDILGTAGENNTEIHAILAEFGLP